METLVDVFLFLWGLGSMRSSSWCLASRASIQLISLIAWSSFLCQRLLRCYVPSIALIKLQHELMVGIKLCLILSENLILSFLSFLASFFCLLFPFNGSQLCLQSNKNITLLLKGMPFFTCSQQIKSFLDQSCPFSIFWPNFWREQQQVSGGLSLLLWMGDLNYSGRMNIKFGKGRFSPCEFDIFLQSVILESQLF